MRVDWIVEVNPFHYYGNGISVDPWVPYRGKPSRKEDEIIMYLTKMAPITKMEDWVDRIYAEVICNLKKYFGLNLTKTIYYLLKCYNQRLRNLNDESLASGIPLIRMKYSRIGKKNIPSLGVEMLARMQHMSLCDIPHRERRINMYLNYGFDSV
jgi:hypothetical protein